MNKKVLAISGSVLFLGGIGLSLYLCSVASDARDLDSFDLPTSQGEGCSIPLEDLSTSNRIISKMDSQALTAILYNSDSNEDCEVAVSLNAPNFNISPPELDKIVNLPPRKRATINWILSPRKLGTFEVTVSAGLSSRIVGIKVVDRIGLLSPFWVKVLSLIGSFLGPMLTLPWWYEQWQKPQDKEA